MAGGAVTYCDTCDEVHPATSSAEPWQWRRLKAPIRPGFVRRHPEQEERS